MAEKVPWPWRWIVDADNRDTGFAMLRRHFPVRQQPAFKEMSAGYRMIGFTHYGHFPLLSAAYGNLKPGETPQHGWQRPDVKSCEAWAYCFRDPDRYLPPGTPRMLVSGSDFINDELAWEVLTEGGRPAKRWDVVYSCLVTWLNELQKNWELAKACILRLADAGLRVAVVGRASLPGLPPHPNIDLLPQVSWSEFIRITASARVAFLPNWWDASPRVLTEALAVDVPVLVHRQILGGWKYLAPETGRFFDNEGDVVDTCFELLDSASTLHPRDWFTGNGYGRHRAAQRLAAELRELGGTHWAEELSYARPTSGRPSVI